MARTTFSPILSAKRELTPTVRELTLRFDPSSRMSFQAGQFLVLHLTQEDTGKRVRRPYSIASSHHELNELRLVIKLVPAGIASTYVEEKLQVGDAVEVSGPFGPLTLRQPLTEKVFFVCTGAGISQHHSYLSSHLKELAASDCHLLFGVWNESEVFYRDELLLIQKQLPKFSFEYVLDEAKTKDWSGKTGYVTDSLDELGFTHDNATFYLCGNPAMIDGMKAALAERGFPKEHIFAEIFR